MVNVRANSLHRAFIFLLAWSAFIGYALIARLVGPRWPEELFVPVWLMALWGLPLLLHFLIRNIYSKVAAVIWIIWLFVGLTNIFASYFVYGSFYLLDVTEGAFIYWAYTTAFFAAIVLTERIMGRWKKTGTIPVPANLVEDVHPAFEAFLNIFPFAWLAGIILAVGYVPLLSSANIEKGMYELDFGPLYGYAAIAILTMVLIFDRFLRAKTLNAKAGLFSLLFLNAVISLATGKRMILVIFVAAAIFYAIRVRGTSIFRSPKTVLSLLVCIVVYAGVMLIRQSADWGGYSEIESQLAIVGVEFRDFVFAVDRFNYDDLADHDWAVSTLAAGINSTILQLLGFDKEELIGKAFGYISKPLFAGGFFGVRTGLVSELYFAYGYWGLLCIAAFGAITAWCGRLIEAAKSTTALIFATSSFGLLATSLVAQSIDTVGTLTVFLYCWVLFLLSKFLPASSKRRAASAAATSQ